MNLLLLMDPPPTSETSTWQTNFLWPMDPPPTSKTSTWQINLFWPMDPPQIDNRCLEYQYTTFGRWTFFGQWTPQMHNGIYIMGCIWHPFWILQEKVGISLYFWIIRVVNSQLALYSHVRCNPLNTPNTLKHLKTPPTWQLQISTMRAHICQV